LRRLRRLYELNPVDPIPVLIRLARINEELSQFDEAII
jgi:hypothetical protein